MRRDASPERRSAVAAAIGRGAELIRTRGHCIGALNDDSGRLCLMGAIREASSAEPRAIRYKAYDEVNKRLRRSNHDIASWNDEQTDKNRVADLLEGVAKEIDPTFTPEPLCWHGATLAGYCATCTWDAQHGNTWYGTWSDGRLISKEA